MKIQDSKNRKLQAILTSLSVVLLFAICAFAQDSNRLGTPAESKGGVSTVSSYAPDKLETVNLANGNLSINLPLVRIGGRGSAALTIMLSYNSKLWSGETQKQLITDTYGGTQIITRIGTRFKQSVAGEELVAGWKLSGIPRIKSKYIEIDPYSTGCIFQEGVCYKYALTKMWLTLPDGSEVELRDELTNGAPYLRPSQYSGDRYRGRVWKSTDGSFITYVQDADNSANGWVFLADGTRMRFLNGTCHQIIDDQGNVLTISGTLNPNALTFVDQLGRQTLLGENTVTVKGYNGMPDRVTQIVIDEMIPSNLQALAVNLRSDYQSIQRPVMNGDYDTQTGVHTAGGVHTDLFVSGSVASDIWMSELMDGKPMVTKVILPDGRELKFRYNPFGEVAEVIYPGGGSSQIDYAPHGSDLCEGAGWNSFLDRRVTQRRLYGSGGEQEATWNYIYGSGYVGSTLYPATQIQARQGSASGAILSDEKHFFLATDANYHWGCGGNNDGTQGSGYERWDNAKVFRIEKQTGTGTEIVEKTWAQRAPVVFVPDPGMSYNAYAAQYGQEQPSNDPRVIQEDVVLEDGKMKRTTFTYDDFNNVTSITEHDFGTAGNPGPILKKTERTYLSNQNGYCYTNLNALDASCSNTIPNDLGTVIHKRNLLLSERILDGANNQKALTEYEYDNYTHDTNRAPIVTNLGMINYDGSKFSSFSPVRQPRGLVTRAKLGRWDGLHRFI